MFRARRAIARMMWGYALNLCIAGGFGVFLGKEYNPLLGVAFSFWATMLIVELAYQRIKSVERALKGQEVPSKRTKDDILAFLSQK